MTFSEIWKQVKDAPDRLRDIRIVHWQDFEQLVKEGEDYFVQTFVGSLLLGDAWLLKGAFPEWFMRDMRTKVIGWTCTTPQSFHKLLDGCPDFHRQIDFETGKKYSILACKHSSYFFRWNDDPLQLWPTITERWRILKIAMGMDAQQYEANKPSDGPTDRIQVVRYPPSIGYLEPHRDAFTHQPCFISGYMGKRGVDYEGGGFYFVNEDDEPRFVENEIDVGDLCIGHANLLHGVAPCKGEASWDNCDGRWFLGLYSNASDYETKRNTSAPVKVKVKDVIPEGA